MLRGVRRPRSFKLHLPKIDASGPVARGPRPRIYDARTHARAPPSGVCATRARCTPLPTRHPPPRRHTHTQYSTAPPTLHHPRGVCTCRHAEGLSSHRNHHGAHNTRHSIGTPTRVTSHARARSHTSHAFVLTPPPHDPLGACSTRNRHTDAATRPPRPCHRRRPRTQDIQSWVFDLARFALCVLVVHTIVYSARQGARRAQNRQVKAPSTAAAPRVACVGR